VTKALKTRPVDPKMRVTCADGAKVAETSGFRAVLRGWHTYPTTTTTFYQVRVRGGKSGGKTLSACSRIQNEGPNGDAAGGAMVIGGGTMSWRKAASDPQLKRLVYDSTGAEECRDNVRRGPSARTYPAKWCGRANMKDRDAKTT